MNKISTCWYTGAKPWNRVYEKSKPTLVQLIDPVLLILIIFQTEHG